ncbi:MAG: protein involved in polysaccharide export with SLBB domain [Planctomycetota bacterium]|jgi:protein involved in polysaccharide export with SLBB domain
MIRVLAALALPLASCALTPSGAPLPDLADEINGTFVSQPTDVISPGDVLELEFVYADDPWDQSPIQVRASGNATFVALDSLQVAGLSLDELDAELTRRYELIVKPAELTVNFTSQASYSVSVLGEVSAPGRYPLDADLTLLDILSTSQGFIRDTARLDALLLVRRDPQSGKLQNWLIDARPRHWLSDSSISLQRDDLIYLPPTAVVRVNDWIDRYIKRNIPVPIITGPL